MLSLANLGYRFVVMGRVRGRFSCRTKPAVCQRVAKLDSQAVVLDARAELPMRVRGGNARGKGFDARVVFVDSADGRHDGKGCRICPCGRSNGEMSRWDRMWLDETAEA